MLEKELVFPWLYNCLYKNFHSFHKVVLLMDHCKDLCYFGSEWQQLYVMLCTECFYFYCIHRALQADAIMQKSTSLTGIDIVLRKQKYSMITCVTQTVLASLGVIVSYYLTNNIYVCTFFIVISFIIVQMLYFGKMYSVMHLKPLNYYMGISVLLVSVLLCSYGLRYAFVWITNVTGLPLFTWLKSFMVM